MLLVGRNMDMRTSDDGVFDYFGEGQIGGMKLAGGNKAIEAHSSEGKSLLLFRKERDARLRYEGEWVCQGLQERRAPDRESTIRLAFADQQPRHRTRLI
jgi:5-methylcytosine-specific restriction protein A